MKLQISRKCYNRSECIKTYNVEQLLNFIEQRHCIYVTIIRLVSQL